MAQEAEFSAHFVGGAEICDGVNSAADEYVSCFENSHFGKSVEPLDLFGCFTDPIEQFSICIAFPAMGGFGGSLVVGVPVFWGVSRVIDAQVVGVEVSEADRVLFF